MRTSGSKRIIRENRSRASTEAPGNNSSGDYPAYYGKSSAHYGNERHPGHVASEGVPRVLNILISSSRSFLAGNKGRPVSIS